MPVTTLPPTGKSDPRRPAATAPGKACPSSTQQLDPFAGEQLAALVMPVRVFQAASGHRLGVFLVQLFELFQHGVAAGRELLDACVQSGLEERHSSSTGISTSHARNCSPSAFACGSKRVLEDTPSPSSPRHTKFRARKIGQLITILPVAPRAAAHAASSHGQRFRQPPVGLIGVHPHAHIGVPALVPGPRPRDSPQRLTHGLRSPGPCVARPAATGGIMPGQPDFRAVRRGCVVVRNFRGGRGWRGTAILAGVQDSEVRHFGRGQVGGRVNAVGLRDRRAGRSRGSPVGGQGELDRLAAERPPDRLSGTRP